MRNIARNLTEAEIKEAAAYYASLKAQATDASQH
jgi:cytochrome c553